MNLRTGKLKRIKTQVMSRTRGIPVSARPLSSRDLGSTPSECLFFYLFRCLLSSMLPLRSVGRSNGLMVCADKIFFNNVDSKATHFNKNNYIMKSTVDNYGEKKTIYIYIYIVFHSFFIIVHCVKFNNVDSKATYFNENCCIM